MRLFFLAPLFAVLASSAFAKDAPVWWNAVLDNADVRLPVAKMHETLTNGFNLIVEKSLTPVTPSELAFESVKSLSTIDQKIVVLKDGSRVLILADGRILKSFSAPNDNDAENWARLVLAALVEARPFSKKAQKSDPQDFYNIFFNAALSSLDPYSHYEPPSEALENLKNPASIGIRYRRVGKFLEITDILPDSPAADSVLEIGDRIAKINDTPITDLSRIQTLNVLRGEAESDLYLTIRKDGKMKQIDLIRKPVKSSPVSYFLDEDDKILTIKISAFTPKTLKALQKTLSLHENENLKGLIIDLRGNTGGLLKEAVLSADLFLPEGLPLIKTKGRHKDADQKYTTTEKYGRPVYPAVILIDGKTASSAEFFAGALQDYRHAVIVGTTSYGKGVIQSVESIPEAGEMYLTWTRYYLPSNYSPDIYGLVPNICTSGKNMSDIDDVPAPVTSLKQRRTGNKKTQNLIRKSCPPQSRANNPLDDEIAKRLILNPKKYEGALTYFSLDSYTK
ncbi:periplasmic protease [Acetobacter sp. CAG:977]|nr:periplasmic protease [Acetobacter sp. CAG:977]